MNPTLEPPSSLATDLVEAMVAAWRRGERPGAEVFLVELDDGDDEAAIRLVFEEASLRREAGLEVAPIDFERRFPRWWPDVALILECERLLVEPGSSPEALPEVGRDLAGFRLLAELGRGAQGRVFLASQFALADRPVVVKVTPVGRDEHLSLARLQHMNIVPLYSAQVLPDRALQVLCMPFLGGATLAQVLDDLEGEGLERRSGARIVEALDRVQASLPVELPPARGPARDDLARSTYVEAIVRIGVGLADGLEYAHDRKFVHMDLKPSNVLVAGDGQPMLLDFHLAREPLSPGDPAPAHLGGTPGYMPPEQLEAIRSVKLRRPIASSLDGRADLYALGVLLDEALGGSGHSSPLEPLHRRNPRVSVGLSDIVARCLEPDPADRYADAAALSADLRRHLEGLPLRGVKNRSLVERWLNWRRRRPHALVRALILLTSAVMTAAASTLIWAAHLQRVREVEAALVDGRGSLARHHHAEAADAFRRGLALLGTWPPLEESRRGLLEGLERARADAKAEELHRLAELVRFRYGLDPPPLEEVEVLARRARAVWQDRALIAASTTPGRDPEADRAIRADLLDLALSLAGLLKRSAPSDESRGEALRVLEEAEVLLGSDVGLERDRRALASGRSDDPSTSPSTIGPSSASGHFELGKSYLRGGEVDRALEQFRKALEIRPQDFWPNFYEGVCAYRLGLFEEAVDAFRVGIALAPDSAECHFNRALAFEGLGRLDEAEGDYTRALARNSSLSQALTNRGMLRGKRGRLEEAETDLRLALGLSPDRGGRAGGHYNLALLALARGDRRAALVNLEIARGLGHESARALLDRLTSPR